MGSFRHRASGMGNGQSPSMEGGAGARAGFVPASAFLPTTRKEVEGRGWEELDVILFSGDAYVDHPSFAAAVIGRLLESLGLRVAVVPQPDWHGDFRDFRKLGRPRLFFAIAPGAMDSMVNKYTANRRLRSEDAYSPDGRHDLRPEYPTIVYTRILKELFPDVPVVLGGIEASLRRLAHYDYWKDELRPCILCDSGADLLIYGMGEKPMTALATLLMEQDCVVDVRMFRNLMARFPQPQTVSLLAEREIPGGIRKDDIVLHSFAVCLRDKRAQAENFRHIEEESNKYEAKRIVQENLSPALPSGEGALRFVSTMKPFDSSLNSSVEGNNQAPSPQGRGP